MRLLKDKRGLIWLAILLIGAVLMGSPLGPWLKALGGLLIGLAYGDTWIRALAQKGGN